jgi:hypothetical protein
MKTYHIKTISGSFYLIKENAKGQLQINMARVVMNPYVNPLNRLQGWQKCEITPWPPQIGAQMKIIRPDIPWGQGQSTLTSPIKEVVQAVKNVR